MYSLDLETAPNSPTSNPYALEPFRVQQGKARITSVSVAGPDGFSITLHEHSNTDDSLLTKENLRVLLEYLHGKPVAAHNAIFDIAWLIATVGIEPVSKINWRCTQLLAKWINNGQEAEGGTSTHYASSGRFSYSLANLVQHYLPNHPLLTEFLEVKEEQHEAGENIWYWLQRGRLDAMVTRDLYNFLMTIIPESMVNGYNIEQDVLVPVANSWIQGINLDVEGAKALKPKIKKAKEGLSNRLGKPEGMFSSPKQLSKYIFEDLGLAPESFTKTGNPSTCADDLKMMAHKLAGTKEGQIIQTILDFKQVKTLESKFIDGILNVEKYVGEPVNHAAPRIFGTYTGRFTYSSATTKKQIHKVGVATHQLPRKGPTRALLRPPEGYVIGELDAAAQELRGMAIESRDSELLVGFNSGLDLHGGMGAHIAGEAYDSYMARYRKDEEDAINFRYAGKLLNLSCQYRIGDKSLASKFFTTYGIVISRAVASSYLRLYKSRYRGVEEYWTEAINKAKANGFAETIGGRQYQLSEWGSKSWATESSAINFPIQGFGADHKDVAISALYQKFPEAILLLDLHDGLWYALPEENAKELLLEMREYVSNLPYADIWDTEVPIPLPFDAKLGTNFGDVKEL